MLSRLGLYSSRVVDTSIRRTINYTPLFLQNYRFASEVAFPHINEATLPRDSKGDVLYPPPPRRKTGKAPNKFLFMLRAWLWTYGPLALFAVLFVKPIEPKHLSHHPSGYFDYRGEKIGGNPKWKDNPVYNQAEWYNPDLTQNKRSGRRQLKAIHILLLFGWYW